MALGDRPGPRQCPKLSRVEGPAQVPADSDRRRVRDPRRPGGDRRLQGRDGDRRQEAPSATPSATARESCSAGSSTPTGTASPRPVELLPGRVRGLPRERPRRRQGARRVPLAQRGGDAHRDRRGDADHGLEAALGRGGVQGPGPGTGLGRSPAARDRAGHPRRALGAGLAQAGDRPSRRRRGAACRAGQDAPEGSHRLEQPDRLEPVRRPDAPRDPGRRRRAGART